MYIIFIENNVFFISGPFKFSAATEEAEKQLFNELNSARMELSLEQANSVEVKRVLKLQLMKNPYDLRGARQLHSILEQYKVTLYIINKISAIIL